MSLESALWRRPVIWGKQGGSSLVELMVGIAVALVLLAGVVTIIVRASIDGGENVQAVRLNQELRSTLDLITKELQRAGFVNWDGANGWPWVNGIPTTNPYTADEGDDPDNLVSNFNARDLYVAVAPAFNSMGNIVIDGSCILFTYDLDGQGDYDAGENFGFRLNGGAVQRKVGGTFSCNDGDWQVITDPSVSITGLTFNMNYISADGEVDGDSARYQFDIPSAIDWNCWTEDTDGDGVVDARGSGLCDTDSDGIDDAVAAQEWPETTLTACIPSVSGVVPSYGDTLCFIRRGITVTLTGQLASDAGVTMVLRNTVKVKNDQFHVSGTAG